VRLCHREGRDVLRAGERENFLHQALRLGVAARHRKVVRHADQGEWASGRQLHDGLALSQRRVELAEFGVGAGQPHVGLEVVR
jgi:hypothetical protein